MTLITPDYAISTCRLGQGALCCRYLTATPKGITCAKHIDEVRRVIDARSAAGTMKAQGDNCPGLVH